jgi:LPS export ABC transporter protein LptC
MGMDAQTLEIRGRGPVLLKLVRTGLVAAAVGAAMLASGCAREEQGAVVEGKTPKLPDQVITDFNLTETAGGRKDWRMEARKASIYEERSVVEADLVTITFYDEAGEVRSVLSARNGVLDRITNDMEARGEVRVTGADGVELLTETLNWSSKDRRISSDDSVTVLRRGDVLTGWGFRGDPDLGTFEILRSMKATIRPESPASEAVPK